MDDSDLQKKLNKAILGRFQRQVDAVNEMAGVLEKKPDSIYRRLRGQTAYTPSEIMKLANAFGISIDSLIFGSSDQVLFSFSLFTRQVTRVEDYLEEVLQNARQIKNLSGAKIYYTTQEIPVFMYYYFPEIFQFKMYLYSLSYWKLPIFTGQKFHFGLFSEKASQLALDVAAIYMDLDSVELWSHHILDHTLNQINYFWVMDQFADPSDALRLCEAIRSFLDHCKKMSEEGKKCYYRDDKLVWGGKYELYINEFASTNDTILIETSAGSMLYTSFGSANFLRTENERLCEEVSEWFNMIITRSTIISKNTAKHRYPFFNQLERRIEKTINNIKETT